MPKAKLLDQKQSITIKLHLKCSEDAKMHDVDVVTDANISPHGMIHALTTILQKIANRDGKAAAYKAAYLAIRELDENNEKADKKKSKT